MDTKEMLAWIRKSMGGDARLLTEQMYRPDLESVLPGNWAELTDRQRETVDASASSFRKRDYLLSPDPESEPYVADILRKIDQRMGNMESGIRPKPCMTVGPAGLGKSTIVDTVIRSIDEMTKGKLRVFEMKSTELLDDPLYAPLNTKNLCALIRDWYEQPDMLSPQTMKFLKEQTTLGGTSRGDSLMSLSGAEYEELMKSLGTHDDIPGLPRFRGDKENRADWDAFSQKVTGFSVQGFRCLSPLGAELLNPRPSYFSLVKIEEFLLLNPQQQDSALGLISAAGSSAETATNAVPFAEKDFLSGYQRRKAMSRQYNLCMSVYVTSNPDESMTSRIGTRMDFMSIPPTYSKHAYKQILARQMSFFLRKKGPYKAGDPSVTLAEAEANPDQYYFKSNLARLSEKHFDNLVEGTYYFAEHLLNKVKSSSGPLSELGASAGRYISNIRESLDALPECNNLFARPCIDWFLSTNQTIARPGLTTPRRLGEDLLRQCIGDDALNTPRSRAFWDQVFKETLNEEQGKHFDEILGETLDAITSSPVLMGLPKDEIKPGKDAISDDPGQDFIRRQLGKSTMDAGSRALLSKALPDDLQLGYSGLVRLGEESDRKFMLIHPIEKIKEGKPDQFVAKPMEFHVENASILSPEERASVARACATIVASQVTDNQAAFTTPSAKRKEMYVPASLHESGEMAYAKVKVSWLIEQRRATGNVAAVVDQIVNPASGLPPGEPAERNATLEEGATAPVYRMKAQPLTVAPAVSQPVR